MPTRTKRRTRNFNDSSGTGRRIRGLRNLGNTCFFNSVLQCLGQTPYFLEILKKNLSLVENSFTRALHDILEELETFSDGATRPMDLLTNLKIKWPQFAGGDQHDSHELLHLILEVVRSESLANKRLQDRLNNNISNPEQVFGGFLITTSVCQDCQLITSHLDDFLDISVPIDFEKPAKSRRISLNVSLNLSNSRFSSSMKRPQRRAKKMAEEAISSLYTKDLTDSSTDHDNSDFFMVKSPARKRRRKKLSISSKSEGKISLESCLKNFTYRELMSDNNKVHCNLCSQENDGVPVFTSITKQLLIAGPPAVLMLHLKRFQFTGYSVRKINKHVSFPLILDVAEYCGSIVETLPHILSNQKKILYSLYGIIEHSGGINGGHYVAYVKSRPNLDKTDQRWSFLRSRDELEACLEDQLTAGVDPLQPFLRNDVDESVIEVVEPKIEPPTGKWYYVSDSLVHEISERAVLQKQAYILFYERIF